MESQRGYIPDPCDENFGFGVYLMEKYGRNQTILSGTANIQKNWDEGIEITACAAWESTFYIIITKDTLLKREELKDLHFCILRGFLLSVLWFIASFKKMTWMRKDTGFVEVSAEVTGEAKS